MKGPCILTLVPNTLMCTHTASDYNNSFFFRTLSSNVPFKNSYSFTCFWVWICDTVSICASVFLNLPPAKKKTDKTTAANLPRMRPSLSLEDINFARVFQRLSPVAEPHSHNLPVVVKLSCNFCNLLARWQRVLLKVGVKDFYRLRRETRASLPFFGWLASDELHQILLAFLVPVLGFSQPLLQDWLQLLSALGGDIQLFKPAMQKKV